jgi:hypothetical protein
MWQGEFAIGGQVIGFEALVDPKPICWMKRRIDVPHGLSDRGAGAKLRLALTSQGSRTIAWSDSTSREACHRVAASCLADIELGRYETQKHRNESSSCVTEEGHASLFL